MDDHTSYTKRWMESLFHTDSNRFYQFSSELTTDFVELISRICSTLSLSAEVEFTCVVNMDRLFQAHLRLKNAIFEKSERPDELKELFEHTLNGVEQEVALFVMILIVICAKFVDMTVPVYLAYFLNFLKQCNRQCTLDEFKRKEFDIFKMMEFKVAPATAYYSSKYFLALCLRKIPGDNVKLTSTCENVLRISFLRREKIYEKIDLQVIADPNRYKNDQTLLGLAVVLAAFILSKYSANQVSQVLGVISTESQISKQLIVYLATMIKDEIRKYEK